MSELAHDAPPAIGAGSALRHIVVVDDSASQRKALAGMLRRQGFQVTEAGSGPDGLAEITRSRADLIISDWMMPGMSGVELCRAYRDLGLDEYGYFILLTSRAEKADVSHAFDCGVDDFLTKPVVGDELRARLVAAERIVAMQRELRSKNRLLHGTLGELRELYAALDRDLDEARRLQQSLVHGGTRRFGAAHVSLFLRAAGHVGGDLVGCFRAGAGHVGVYGIDVSGHGIASALMAARLSGLLSGPEPGQNVALYRDSCGAVRMRPPEVTCAELNRLKFGAFNTEQYFTLVLADIDLVNLNMRICQAGHPPPLVINRDGEGRYIGSGGMPIGLVSDARYESFEVALNRGDRMLIYSDGMTECTEVNGRMVGEERFAELAAGLTDLRDQDFFDALVWRLFELAGTTDLPDDISAALVELA